MIAAIHSLYSWMPTSLALLFTGLIAFFCVWAVVKIVKVILDLIPFV